MMKRFRFHPYVKTTLWLLHVAIAMVNHPAVAEVSSPQPIAGYWLTDDKDGVIEIYDCGTDVCGRFHWLKDDNAEDHSRDDHNHDPALRNRPLCGLQFMGGFKPEGNGDYTGGRIYSVRDGNTYDANLKLVNSTTLELRGYFLVPFLGETRTWTRTGPEPACREKK